MNTINTKPTVEMADAARRGLDYRAKFGRGGTAVGVARARDIKNRKNLSEDTINRMHSYFSRHKVDKDAKGSDSSGYWGNANNPSAGYVAWLLWGGDPGMAWSARKVKEIKRSKGMLLSRNKIPVKEFRVLKFGTNKTTKGNFDLTKESADILMANYRSEFLEANPVKYVQINYNHAPWDETAVANPDSGIAAGWCSLELRDDGIWAVKVDWTGRATKYISHNEYKYFSPEVDFDEAGSVIRLSGIALTNIPAMNDVAPVGYKHSNYKELSMNMDEFVAKIKEMLGLADVEDLQVVIEKLIEAVKPEPAVDEAVEEEVVEAGSEEMAEEVGELPMSPEAMAAMISDLAARVAALEAKAVASEEEMLMAQLIAAGAPKGNEKRLSQLAILVRADRKSGESIKSAVLRHAEENKDLYSSRTVARNITVGKPHNTTSTATDDNDKMRQYNLRRTRKGAK